MADPVIPELRLSDITEVKMDGVGAFDTFMRAAKLHLDDQYNANRIRGPEYATVYLGQLEQALQGAIGFATSKQRITLELALLNKQIELAAVEVLKANAQLAILQEQAQTAVIERQLVAKQVEKVQADIELTNAQKGNIIYEQHLLEANAAKVNAEILNIPKQGTQIDAQTSLINSNKTKVDAEILLVPKQGEQLDAQVCLLKSQYDASQASILSTEAQTTLFTQKVATEKAQILSLGVDQDSIVGRQKALYLAQASGFQRDAEQKTANLYIDVWKTLRMTDNEFQANATQGLDDATIGKVMLKLRTGVNAL